MNQNLITIDGYKIELSNLDKVLFPKSGITKGDLITYYETIAPIALPLYKNRPLTMQRCPDGIDKQNFIQKEIPDYFPPWIESTELSKKEGSVRHVLVNKAATFVYLANQACITFHLGLAQAGKLDFPRYLLFDLDPSSKDLGLLKKVVRRVKELGESLGLIGFIQTTGSRGFHVYFPLKKELNFEEVRAFARKSASYLAEQYPDEITIEQRKENRGARVFIDYARNSYSMNEVAPYSVRALENAPVATPIHWKELEDKDLHSQSFTIKTIPKRLKEFEDPWKDLLTTHCSLKSARVKFEKLIK